VKRTCRNGTDMRGQGVYDHPPPRLNPELVNDDASYECEPKPKPNEVAGRSEYSSRRYRLSRGWSGGSIIRSCPWLP
jgi:hypothetical protein